MRTKYFLIVISLFFSLLNSEVVFSQSNTPCGAPVLAVNAGCVNTLGTTVGQTYQTNAANGGTPTCASPGAPDVWYQFVAPASGSVTITTDVAGITDGGMSLNSGPCGSPTQIVCDDDGGPGLMPMITQTGLTPGVSYWIRFWAYGGTNTGTFNICITPGPTPATNNECATATALTVNPDYLCGTVTPGTVLGATASANATAPCFGTADDDVWYSFVATSTSHRVSLTNVAGSTTDMYHAVYSGTCGSLTNIACNDADQTDLVGLTIGATYYVRVYTWTSTTGQTSTFNVCIGTAPPPPTCPGGLGTYTSIASLPYTHNGQTTCGDVDNITSANIITCGSTSYNTGEDYVYVFTPATTGSITIGVTSTGTYMGLQLFDGCPFSTGTCSWSAQSSAGNQSGCAGVVAGHTYYLIIDSWASPACNPYSLSISAVTVGGLANDNCAGATPLPVNATCTYTNSTNACATPTAGVPAPGCGNYLGGDVWFSAVVPASGNIQFDGQAGGMLDGAMALYTGTCASLSLAACDDNSSTNASMPHIVRSGLTPGSTVYIRFWEYGNDAPGTFGICAQTYVPPIPNNQDCLGAIPICQNTYSTAIAYSGTGNILGEISSGISCLGAGEKNDVWYVFTVLSSGNLDFTINPNTNTDDYDWAVYNLTTNNCQDIASNASLEVSCNFSGSTTVYNSAACTTTTNSEQGNTGPNGYFVGCNILNEDVVPVTAGQTYVINVSQYSTSVDGYTIDFSASTASIFDNVPPSFSSVNTPIPCGATSITVNFSENVSCSTASTADFTLTGPGGPYTITAISSANCSAGATYDNTFTMNVSPAITTSGTFTIALLPVAVAGSVSDICGNTAPAASFNFTINNISATTNQTNVLCPGATTGQASATGSGGTAPYSYLWSTGGATQTITNLPAGTYTVTTTDAGGCKYISTVTITQPAAIVLTPSMTQATCGSNNGTATITVTSGGTGPWDYAWSNGSNTNNTASTTNTISSLAANTYTVTVNDNNNCTATGSVNVTSTGGVTSTFSQTANRCLTGNTFNFTNTGSSGGGYTYSWTFPGGTPASSTTNNQNNVTWAAAGTYTITHSVTGPGPCTSTTTSTITVYPQPTVTFTQTNITCSGLCNGTATASPSGVGYSYVWNDPAPVQTTQTANALCAGPYNVTVTDPNGCTGVNTVTITSPAAMVLNATRTNVTCNGLCNGTANVAVTSGGTGPFTYAWGAGSTPNAASTSSLCAGTFTVTVTDANLCTATASVVVTQPTLLTSSITAQTNVSCNGGSNGSATVTAAGGTAPY
ncbi:MAG: SprB repeat-containing protein, partial [Bacteroidia bacterium]|nr:SprB repeat-containing protein [Bacteroidia bacterium]